MLETGSHQAGGPGSIFETQKWCTGMTSDRSAMNPLGFVNLLCFLEAVAAEFLGPVS